MKHFLIFLCVFFTGCASDTRAQAGADARAGIDAATMANHAGDHAKTDAILKAATNYLPAATGVPSKDWPAPVMQAPAIVANPQQYAAYAPPEPLGGIAWAGIGVAALALLRIAGPLVPGVGPFLKLAADATWTVMATRSQKKEDRNTIATAAAALALAPLLEAIQRVPPEELPLPVAVLLESRETVAALAAFNPPI